MPRRSSSRRRDWRLIVFLAISALIVLTMVLASLLPALTPPK